MGGSAVIIWRAAGIANIVRRSKVMNRGGRTGVLVLSAVLAGASGCAASTAALRQEEAKSNTQTVLAFEETVYNKHQIQEGFAHYVGQMYREHDERLGEGRETAIRALSQLVSSYPSSRANVQRTIAQGNLVAVQLIWNAQSPPARGIARVDIYRLEDGRIIEHWAVAQEPLPIAALANAVVGG
jgi:predicted SnoaL-like aldol condensation-catalyzing enzyme